MADTNTTPQASAYTALGTARTEKVVLPEATFDGVINVPVMHKAVTAFLANQRQGNASTKIRKYVTGGNQKPWKQKGTGRARQGSTRAPHWVGGGTVVGRGARGGQCAGPVAGADPGDGDRAGEACASRGGRRPRRAQGREARREVRGQDRPQVGREEERGQEGGQGGQAGQGGQEDHGQEVGREEVHEEEGEVTDADASSHDRATAHHRSELGRVPGPWGVPLRC